MKRTVIAYCSDVLDNAAHKCIVSSAWNELPCTSGIGHQPLISIESDEGLSVTLSVYDRDDVAMNDVLLPRWVFSALAIKAGSRLQMLCLQPSPLSRASIKLTYFGHVFVRHWDEVADQSEQKLFSIYKTWPQGIRYNALSSVLPCLLHKRYLFHESMIGVIALDTVLVFLVDATCRNDPFVFDLKTCQVDISSECFIQSQESLIQTANAIQPVLDSYTGSDFIGDTMDKLTHLFDDKDKRDVSRLPLPTSFLVVGPRGAGLTTFIDAFNSIEGNGIMILKLHTKYIQSVNTEISEALNVTVCVREDIANVLKLLVDVMGDEAAALRANRYIEDQKRDAASTISRLIVLIDDIDPLLTDSDNNDSYTTDASFMEISDAVKLAASILRRLLYLLKTTAAVMMRWNMTLVATSHLSRRLLPRYHSGFPEFERVVTLMRPTHRDRCGIFSRLLQLICSSHSSIELEAIESVDDTMPSDNIHSDYVSAWSNRLAGITAGYLPGDIALMVKHAARSVLLYDNSQLSYSKEGSKVLKWKDMLDAHSAVPPLLLRGLGRDRDGFELTHSRTWEDIGGYKKAKTTLKRAIGYSNYCLRDNDGVGERRDLHHDSDTRASFSVDGPRGIVLHGPSGCGKTFFASVIASEAKMNFISTRCTDLLSKYFGQTEASVRDLFARARACLPCTLFFDDFDAIACRRGMVGGSGGGSTDVNARVLSTFLNELDGIMSSDSSSKSAGFEGGGGLLVIVACVDISLLDEALVRPGRLHTHVYLGYPDEDDIEDIITTRLRSMPVAEDVSPCDIVQHLIASSKICGDALIDVGTERITGATINGIVRGALFCALREKVEVDDCSKLNTNQSADRDVNVIFQRHFLAAIDNK